MSWDLLVPSKTLKRHRCPTSQTGSGSLEGVRAMARAAQAERAQGTRGRQAGSTSPLLSGKDQLTSPRCGRFNRLPIKGLPGPLRCESQQESEFLQS